MKNKLKTTLLILSYERHNALKRYISFLSNYCINVVIMDGSDKTLFSKSEVIFGNASFKYEHMPSEGNNYVEIGRAHV